MKEYFFTTLYVQQQSETEGARLPMIAGRADREMALKQNRSFIAYFAQVWNVNGGFLLLKV